MDTESMPAWTLPELLVVMILSGLIFLALSEATDLVGRFTGYLTERWVRTEGELSACHRLDELISRTDSIIFEIKQLSRSFLYFYRNIYRLDKLIIICGTLSLV